MANGVPVRLSANLTARARSEASLQERSLTEQVEHWARLGQAVEAAVQASTILRLKARSHDPELHERIAASHTPAARAEAARVIAETDPVRYGTNARGKVIRVSRRTKRR